MGGTFGNPANRIRDFAGASMGSSPLRGAVPGFGAGSIGAAPRFGRGAGGLIGRLLGRRAPTSPIGPTENVNHMGENAAGAGPLRQPPFEPSTPISEGPAGVNLPVAKGMAEWGRPPIDTNRPVPGGGLVSDMLSAPQGGAPPTGVMVGGPMGRGLPARKRNMQKAQRLNAPEVPTRKLY